MTQPPFYALQTRHGSERKAAQEVAALGLHVWCPVSRFERKVRNKRGSQRVLTEVALLPTYIFARVPDHMWHALAGIKPRLRCIVGLDGSPRPVRNMHEISDLMHREETGEFDRSGVDIISQRFNAGDVLKIMLGPFADWQATVIDATAAGIKASVVMFGAEREIEVNPRVVKKVV